MTAVVWAIFLLLFTRRVWAQQIRIGGDTFDEPYIDVDERHVLFLGIEFFLVNEVILGDCPKFTVHDTGTNTSSVYTPFGMPDAPSMHTSEVIMSFHSMDHSRDAIFGYGVLFSKALQKIEPPRDTLLSFTSSGFAGFDSPVFFNNVSWTIQPMVVNVAELPSNCSSYWPQQQDYRGLQWKTSSGKNCQPWDVNPWGIDDAQPVRPFGVCSNLLKRKEAAWCYLADPDPETGTFWEYCDIPNTCGDEDLVRVPSRMISISISSLNLTSGQSVEVLDLSSPTPTLVTSLSTGSPDTTVHVPSSKVKIVWRDSAAAKNMSTTTPFPVSQAFVATYVGQACPPCQNNGTCKFDTDAIDIALGYCECPSSEYYGEFCEHTHLWTCEQRLYDAGDGICNCGCGIPDPDCVQYFPPDFSPGENCSSPSNCSFCPDLPSLPKPADVVVIPVCGNSSSSASESLRSALDVGNSLNASLAVEYHLCAGSYFHKGEYVGVRQLGNVSIVGIDKHLVTLGDVSLTFITINGSVGESFIRIKSMTIDFPTFSFLWRSPLAATVVFEDVIFTGSGEFIRSPIDIYGPLFLRRVLFVNSEIGCSPRATTGKHFVFASQHLTLEGVVWRDFTLMSGLLGIRAMFFSDRLSIRNSLLSDSLILPILFTGYYLLQADNLTVTSSQLAALGDGNPANFQRTTIRDTIFTSAMIESIYPLHHIFIECVFESVFACSGLLFSRGRVLASKVDATRTRFINITTLTAVLFLGGGTLLDCEFSDSSHAALAIASNLVTVNGSVFDRCNRLSTRVRKYRADLAFLPPSSSNGGCIAADGDSTSSLVAVDSVFKNSIGGLGGAIYVENTGVTLLNCTFTGNVALQTAGALFLANSEDCSDPHLAKFNAIISNQTKFLGCSADLYGVPMDAGAVFVGSARTLLVHDSVFRANIAQRAPAIMVDGLAEVQLSNSCFVSNTAYGDGGAIRLNSLQSEVGFQTHLISRGCFFSNNSAGGSGGSLSLARGSRWNSTRDVFNSSVAITSGGVVQFDESLVALSNANIVGSSAALGGALSCRSGVLILHSCGIRNCSAGSGGGMIIDGCSVSIVAGEFSNLVAKKDGGAIYASGARVNVSGSTFLSNSAKYGGIAQCKFSTAGISFANVVGVDNTATSSGGCFDLVAVTQPAINLVANSTFRGGYALDGGFVSSSLCAFQMEGLSINGLHRPVILFKLTGTGGVWSLLRSIVTISSTVVSDISAEFGGMLLAITSTVRLKNVSASSITCTAGCVLSIHYKSDVIWTGGRVHSLSDSDCVCGSLGNIAGSSVTLQHLDVWDAQSRYVGGLIFLSSDAMALLRVENTLFSGLEASFGSPFYAAAQTKMDFVNTSFSAIFVELGSLLECQNCAVFSFENCSFDGIFSPQGAIQASQGIGEYLVDMQVLYCHFNSIRGRAISTFGSALSVWDSSFSHCSSSDYGGAIRISGTENGFAPSTLAIWGSSFYNNSAACAGGAVYWFGSQPPAGLAECAPLSSGNTAPQGDFAASAAMFVSVGTSVLTLQSAQPVTPPLVATLLDFYGSPAYWTDFTVALNKDASQDFAFLGATVSVSNMSRALFPGFGVRGQPNSTFYFQVVAAGLQSQPVRVHIESCKVGETVLNDECIPCSMNTFSVSSNPLVGRCQPCMTGAVCVGGQVIAQRGYWRKNGSWGICKKVGGGGSGISLTSLVDGSSAESEAVRYIRGSVGNEALQKAILGNYPDVACDFIACRNADACNGVSWLSGSAYGTARKSDSGECIISLHMELATIAVNDTLLLRNGFRGTVVSFNASGPEMMSVELSGIVGACHSVSGVSVYLLQEESCGEGFSGNLCASCSDLYGRVGSFGCEKCPDSLVFTSILVVACIALSIGAGLLLISSAFKAFDNPTSRLGGLGKCFSSYLQMTALCLRFNLNWPHLLQKLFEAQHTASSAGSQQLVSVDCLLQRMLPNIRPFYVTQVILLALPLLVVGVCLLFWAMYKPKQQSWTIRKRKAVSSMIVLLFLVYPTVANCTLRFFQCVPLTYAKSYLLSDLETACGSDSLLKWQIFAGGPAVVLYAVGIPLFSLVILFRARKSLFSSAEVQASLGFLYAGLRRPMYFWEVFRACQKLLIIALTIFSDELLPEVEALLALALLLVFFCLHSSFAPFQDKVLNRVESHSLLLTIFTLYVGIAFKFDVLSSAWGTIGGVAAILLLNALFTVEIAVWSWPEVRMQTSELLNSILLNKGPSPRGGMAVELSRARSVSTVNPIGDKV